VENEGEGFNERIQAIAAEKDRLGRCITELQEERDDLMDAVIELLDVLTDPLTAAAARRRVIDGLIRVSGWRGYMESAGTVPEDDPSVTDPLAIPHYHDDALLTLRLAAGVLSVSYSTLTKWTARGEFCPEAFKLPNGEYRVRYRDLIRWALSMRASA
jgi:hypothetical protein